MHQIYLTNRGEQRITTFDQISVTQEKTWQRTLN